MIKVKLFLLTAAIFFMLSGCDSLFIDVYETNSINDYGQYIGNSDNSRPNRLLKDFMPKILLQEYDDIVYHYKALTSDTNACEVYLEFSVPSEEVFLSFFEERDISPSECVPAACFQGKYEVSYASRLDLCRYDEYTTIEYADIRKIYFDKESKHIIFFALIVYDGGGTRTYQLNYFFDRFNIDPAFLATNIWQA